MSPALPAVTGRQVARVAGRSGFLLDRQKGSHAVYYRESDGARVVIPMHRGKVIKPKTLAAIIDDMRLTVAEFTSLL